MDKSCSQPGTQGVPSGLGEGAEPVTPELEDALPRCAFPNYHHSRWYIWRKEHPGGGGLKSIELMRWRDSGKLYMREAGWAADLKFRNSMEQLTVR